MRSRFSGALTGLRYFAIGLGGRHCRGRHEFQFAAQKPSRAGGRVCPDHDACNRVGECSRCPHPPSPGAPPPQYPRRLPPPPTLRLSRRRHCPASGWVLMSAPMSASSGPRILVASIRAPSPGGAFTGGIQVGYNWQSGPWVYGVEADFNLSSVSEQFAEYQFSNPWFGTMRGRAGYLINNFFFYGTAGLAFGVTTVASGGLSDSSGHLGWAVGAGVEFGLAPLGLVRTGRPRPNISSSVCHRAVTFRVQSRLISSRTCCASA